MINEVKNAKCPNCDNYLSKGGKFCGSCGRCLEPDKKSIGFTVIDFDRAPLRSFMFIVSIMIIVILIAETLFLIALSYDILVSMGSANVVFSFVSPTLNFAPYYVSRNDIFNQLYWLFVVFSILLSVIYMLHKFIESLKSAKDENDSTPVEKSGLFWIGILICTVLAADFLYVLIIQMVGQTLDNPFGLRESAGNLYLYANAPIWEEIATRVFYIGIPIVIVELTITKKKGSVKYILGGFGVSKLSLVLIVMSSIIFGFAHQPTWGIYKVIPAAYLGFALGYLYARFGLYASIVFHFLYNYRLVFSWIGSDELSGLIMTTIIFTGLFTAAYIIKELRNNRGVLKARSWLINKINEDTVDVRR